MNDELVHGPLFLAEAGDSITTLLRGPEFGFVEWVVFCADYGEVETHFGAFFVQLEWEWSVVGSDNGAYSANIDPLSTSRSNHHH